MSELKRTGDTSTGGAVGTEHNEVVWCGYSPDSSGCLIRSIWTVDGRELEKISFAFAALRPDGQLSYWVGAVPLSQSIAVAPYVKEVVLTRANSGD